MFASVSNGFKLTYQSLSVKIISSKKSKLSPVGVTILERKNMKDRKQEIKREINVVFSIMGVAALTIIANAMNKNTVYPECLYTVLGATELFLGTLVFFLIKENREIM